MSQPRFVIEEVNDPVEVARFRAQAERARRNSDWLQAHWPELLPRARGKFLAVAGQEAFIADSLDEAWDLAMAAHPEDDGAHLQYVRPERGPRIYANHIALHHQDSPCSASAGRVPSCQSARCSNSIVTTAAWHASVASSPPSPTRGPLT